MKIFTWCIEGSKIGASFGEIKRAYLSGNSKEKYQAHKKI